jgi:type VII secretion integral membrane protein EccD
MLLPVTIVHDDERTDLALPANVPVAELLPGLVKSVGVLNADTATRGFELKTQSGRTLAQAQNLTDQEVRAGAILLLAPTDTSAETRYDDLVEAIGKSVATSRTAWQPGDSIQLSAYAAVGLLAVATALLLTGEVDPPIAGIIAAVAAILVTLAAAVVGRVQQSIGGGIALAMCAPLLAGVAAYLLLAGQGTFLQLGGAGAAVLLGSAAVLVLPQSVYGCAGGPALVGAAVLALAALDEYVVRLTPTGIQDHAGAALLITLLTLGTLLAPWIGLAQMPARIDVLSGTSTAPVELRSVNRQLMGGDKLVLSLRVAAGALTVVFAYLLAPAPIAAPLLLATGITMILGTRSLYGRAEALVTVISGILTLVVSGVRLADSTPGFLPWIVGAAILVAVFVLANNVVTPKLRPGLARAADTIHVIALIALLPLTAIAWGVLG